MRIRLCLLAGIAATVCLGTASAQEDAAAGNAKPRYVVLPPTFVSSPVAAAPPLTTFNGSFTYNATKYNYNMVGNSPSSNSTVTVQAYIIPIKVVITSSTGTKTTFDPQKVLPNGKTVVNNTIASPIFDATTTYIAGSTNVGTTQYIDAFQRANFWGIVASHPNYHLLLGGPTVLAEQTLSPPSSKGHTGNPFGNLKVAEVDINWFDAQLLSLITKLGIQPSQVPIFLTYDTYLTQGGCCIGGYHSATTNTLGTQAYMHASYIDKVGDFAQDVSALSHELGEWANDPLVASPNGNQTPCGILEVGDPLEGAANYGGYPYTVNGFAYNLQDMVFLPYFGAPTRTSVNGWLSLHGAGLTVCSNGP